MSKFTSYYDFMNEYIEFYETVMELEDDKLEALLSNDLDRIVPAMTEYQTCIKQAQQYEQKRIDLCRELGFENMAFSAISKCFEGDEKKKLVVQKDKLDNLIKNIQYMNRKSMELANVQLAYVDELATAASQNSHMYNSKGKSDSVLKNSQLLNTKV